MERALQDRILHTKFAVLLYSMLHGRLEEFVVIERVREAVGIEMASLAQLLAVAPISIAASFAPAYVKASADRLLTELGYSSIYKTHNQSNLSVVHLVVPAYSDLSRKDMSCYPHRFVCLFQNGRLRSSNRGQDSTDYCTQACENCDRSDHV